MAKTIDDVCYRLDRLFDAINNIAIKGGGSGNGTNTNIDDIISDSIRRLGDLSDNLDKYNTTFEKELITNQEKNAKELDKLQKEHLERFEKFKETYAQEYKKYEEQIKKAKEKLEKENSSAAERKQARKEIEQAERKIKQRNKQFEQQKTSKRNVAEIERIKREIAEDQEDRRRFRNSKIGRNISKFEDTTGNMRMYGKQMQVFGKSIGGGFGKAVSSTGKGLATLSRGLSRFAGPIGAVITAAQLLNDAFVALAQTTNELQRVQNEASTIKTQRDIKLNTLEYQDGIDQIQTAAAIASKRIALETTIGLQQAQIAVQKANAALGTGLTSITEGINESAWSALNKKIEIEGAETKSLNERKYGEEKLLNETAVLKGEYTARSTERFFEGEKAKLDAISKMTENQVKEYNIAKEHPFATSFSSDKKTKSGVSGKDYGEIKGQYNMGRSNAQITGILDGIGLGGFTNKQMQQQAEVERQLTEMQNNTDATAALSKNTNDLRLANLKASTEISNSIIDYKKSLKDITVEGNIERRKMYTQFSQKIETLAFNLQKELYSSGNSKGLTQYEQLRDYNISMQKTMSSVTALTGMTFQELMNIQNSYGAGTGRSLFTNSEDLTKAAYIAKFSGDINLPSELANATEIFNMGMSDTMELINKMTMKVNKMGLDGRKYMKDMSSNLKMAQKYTFKNGVQGVMNMAKWAQNVRFDMSQLPTILEKLLDGGLEGAITQGAQLQVLGGHFAMGADPLAMMYEAIDDPDALAKRYAGMLKGMGTWNSNTGQVEFKGPSGLMLRQMAKITGLSVDSLRNMASQDLKKEKMGNVFSSNSGLDEEQKASLINKAYYKNGEWMVNGLDGKAMKVSQINSSNINNVQADTYEGTVEQSLAHIISSLDLLTGATQSSQLDLTRSITQNGDLERNANERIMTWQEHFSKNFEEYKEIIVQNMDAATQAYVENITQDAQSIEEAIALQLLNVNSSINNFQADYNKVSQSVLSYLKQNGFVDSTEWQRNAGKGGASGGNGRTIAIGTGTNQGEYQNYSVAELGKNGIITGYNADGTYKFDSQKFNMYFKGQQAFNGWVSESDKNYNKSLMSANNTEPKLSSIPKVAEAQKAAQKGDYTTAVQNAYVGRSSIMDGVLSSNNSSMLTAASNVTPIHDGSVQLAKSDPKDMALFAKSGGPFDTLFNGIFAKINEVSSVLPKSLEYIMPLAKVVSSFGNSKDTINNGTIKVETIKIELNGKLELSGSNGQNIDIINEIKNNPMLLRSLSQLIGESINKNINGGKSSYTNGISTPRFNDISF